MVAAMAINMPGWASSDPSTVAHKPRLVVVISVDQLRRDRLTHSHQAGLHRLASEGRNFPRGQLAHAISTTCPGHAAILTGVNPNKHGIVNNTFYDRSTGKVRYCVDDDDPSNRVLGGESLRSPRNLWSTTLGDWLKKRNAAHKVFSIAGKDRAAITLGGHQPNGVLWFDRNQGRFTSSQYYYSSLPSYVQAFNGSEPTVDGFMRHFPEFWHHPAGTLRADDFPGEDPKFETISGHPLRTGPARVSAAGVYASPFLDQATLELARITVTEEQLGRDQYTDLLALGLSATDTVGHLYGPRSAEAEDALTKLDIALGQFLNFLDASVGRDHYWIVLTADHGVAELPEHAAAQGTLACDSASGRLTPQSLFIGLYWHLYKTFTWPIGDPRELVDIAGGHLVINPEVARRYGTTRAEVSDTLITYLESSPEIDQVWPVDRLAKHDSALAQRFRASYVPSRSGDLAIMMSHGCLIGEFGTTHGSAHDYDIDIPLLFYGTGITPGEVLSDAYSIDIAPTLATALGLVPDQSLDGKELPLTGPTDGSASMEDPELSL